MNTIIVPTDFSPAAENATAYAAQLARKISASVLLLHVYGLPVPMADYPVLMVTADDVKKSADRSLHHALENAKQAFADVQFETASRMGDVVTEIEEVCRQRPPFALVAGTKEVSGFDRFLFGDTVASLARNCSYPLIAVPENSHPGMPVNVVLATDMQNSGEIPAEKISAIVRQLGASLHIVHVEMKNVETIPAEDLLKAFSGVNASYHCITDKDVEEGLKQYVQQNNIDLVLVLPHKHNFYERLFFRQHTQGILHSMPVPVMSLR
jgi:nucleotide-binding universal stress UspA family protein